MTRRGRRVNFNRASAVRVAWLRRYPGGGQRPAAKLAVILAGIFKIGRVLHLLPRRAAFFANNDLIAPPHFIKTQVLKRTGKLNSAVELCHK